MLAEPMLDLSRRRDRSRTSFRTGTTSQPYRLPHAVKDRLTAALEPFRNGERALALATFLGRFWSMPGRVALPFPIDRRALADREGLGLTEGEVRGAIRTLEAVGFLNRWQTTGSRYKPTVDGLRRKPIPYMFGPDYAPLFVTANGRAAAARGRQDGARRSPDRTPRPSQGLLEGRSKSPIGGLKLPHNLPKGKEQAEPLVLMGNLNLTPLPKLSETALRAIGKAGGR